VGQLAALALGQGKVLVLALELVWVLVMEWWSVLVVALAEWSSRSGLTMERL
jgi:hypothetical protein